jgi:hypothetical protein
VHEFLTCLRLAIREVLHPSPLPEPDEDLVTPAAFRQWVGGHKHPRECAGGCRCKGG